MDDGGQGDRERFDFEMPLIPDFSDFSRCAAVVFLFFCGKKRFLDVFFMCKVCFLRDFW